MGKDDPDVLLRSRVERLEGEVRILAHLLNATISSIGALNVHVGLGGGAGDPDTPEAFRERANLLDKDLRELRDQLQELWPNIKPSEGTQN